MIDKIKPVSLVKRARRPGFGAKVLRGIMLIVRIYRSYSRTGYLPLVELNPKERDDVRRAILYLEQFSGWYFWLTKDRRKERMDKQG
jgi:hypothetical protein